MGLQQGKPKPRWVVFDRDPRRSNCSRTVEREQPGIEPPHGPQPTSQYPIGRWERKTERATGALLEKYGAKDSIRDFPDEPLTARENRFG